MTTDKDLEWADAQRDTQIDNRMTRGVCIRCEGPMPAGPQSGPSMRPAKCPACAPSRWVEFFPETYVGNEWNYAPLVGRRVDSPIGLGTLTGSNPRGFPMVDEVTVTWVIALPLGESRP